MKRIRAFILSIALALGLGGPIVLSAVSYADPSDSAKGTVCETLGTQSDCMGGRNGEATGAGKISDTLQAVINIMSWIVGILAVVFIIVAGYRYITSSGDANKVNSAKNTLVYALIGLVIVALAQVIVAFTLDKVTHPNEVSCGNGYHQSGQTCVKNPTCANGHHYDVDKDKCVANTSGNSGMAVRNIVTSL